MDEDTLDKVLKNAEIIDVDFKRTFPPYYFDSDKKSVKYEKARATVVKDVAAMANAESANPGYIVYGINDQDGRREVFKRDKIEREDESRLSSFLTKYLDPAPKIEYGEFIRSSEVIGLLRVHRMPEYPHIVRKTYGGLIHPGQVFYREGTATKIALREKLAAMFKGALPFNINHNDEEVIKISTELQQQGWYVSWVPEHELDVRLQCGGSLLYKLGTRRPYRANSNFTATSWDYLVKRLA